MSVDCLPVLSEQETADRFQSPEAVNGVMVILRMIEPLVAEPATRLASVNWVEAEIALLEAVLIKLALHAATPEESSVKKMRTRATAGIEYDAELIEFERMTSLVITGAAVSPSPACVMAVVERADVKMSASRSRLHFPVLSEHWMNASTQVPLELY